MMSSHQYIHSNPENVILSYTIDDALKAVFFSKLGRRRPAEDREF